MGVPPGSRVTTTSCPRARRASASRRHWVDLPAPSPPSKTTNAPGMGATILTQTDIAGRASAAGRPFSVGLAGDSPTSAPLRRGGAAHRRGCRHGAGTGSTGESCARGRADPRPGDLGPGDGHRRRRPGRLPGHRDAADARRRPDPGPGAVRRLRGHGSRPADRQHCHGCHAGDDRATRGLGTLAGTDRRELGPGRRAGHVRPGRGSGSAAEPDPGPRRRCGAAARGRDVRPVRRHRGAARPAAGLREALTPRHPLRAGDRSRA